MRPLQRNPRRMVDGFGKTLTLNALEGVSVRPSVALKKYRSCLRQLKDNFAILRRPGIWTTSYDRRYDLCNCYGLLQTQLSG
jgi:hypothetical protein